MTLPMEPRGWQQISLEKFMSNVGKFYLQEATPGSGKTLFSAFCMAELKQRGEIDFFVVVVPTTALKGDKNAGFLGDYSKVGLDITTHLKEARPAPRDFDGAVVTYQQLPNLVETFKSWKRRLAFVFDEIHHASDQNKWGAAASRCSDLASKVLGMTGTPFRGDETKISFVEYDARDKAIAHDSYTYREAVADGICRNVLFRHDDGVASYIWDEKEEVRISETNTENESKVTSTIFAADSEFLRSVIEQANEKLDEYRVSDIDAGGLMICRPGGDPNDERHLHKVADLVRRVTGESPTVISHEDPDANSKIERFRENADRWLVSVRKVSEGVDIKRLRVEVMASAPHTELLFRQLVGRVVRQERKDRVEEATVFIAKLPRLKDWAQRIMDEAKAGLRAKKPPRESSDGVSEGPDFIPLGATHEHGGGVSDFGERFTAAEIAFAESMKRGDRQLSHMGVADIAHLVRKMGVQPEAQASYEEPLQIQKKKKRREINKASKHLALKYADGGFGKVWKMLYERLGVADIDDLHDNHPLSAMDAALEILEAKLQVWDDAVK